MIDILYTIYRLNLGEAIASAQMADESPEYDGSGENETIGAISYVSYRNYRTFAESIGSTPVEYGD